MLGEQLSSSNQHHSAVNRRLDTVTGDSPEIACGQWVQPAASAPATTARARECSEPRFGEGAI